MATPVIMPRQGQSVESCILTQWFREPGEEVSRGDVLFAYETDKAAFEEVAPEDGVLLVRYFEEGDEVPVLTNVAVIGKKGEKVDSFTPEVPSGQPEPGKDAMTAPDTDGPQERPEPKGSRGTHKPAVSPRARKLANEKRVVLDQLTGSGPGGRIIERDVLEAIRHGKRLTPLAQKKMEDAGLSAPLHGKSPYGRITSRDLVDSAAMLKGEDQAADPGGYDEVPLTNVRRIIASAMYRSLQNSAQLTHHLSANASKLLRLRNRVKKRMEEGSQVNITLNDMVCYAAIRALRLFPEANAHFVQEKVRIFRQVNLGLAVDTERGLLVPSLPGADHFSLETLSIQLSKLAEDARAGNVSPDLLAPEAASFTVSNLGNYGVEMFTPVINLPQVAILGVNTIVYRPAVLEDGTFGFQPFLGLSLTYDHRAIDGGPATRFLAEIKNQIEQLSDEML